MMRTFLLQPCWRQYLESQKEQFWKNLLILKFWLLLCLVVGVDVVGGERPLAHRGGESFHQGDHQVHHLQHEIIVGCSRSMELDCLIVWNRTMVGGWQIRSLDLARLLCHDGHLVGIVAPGESSDHCADHRLHRAHLVGRTSVILILTVFTFYETSKK